MLFHYIQDKAKNDVKKYMRQMPKCGLHLYIELPKLHLFRNLISNLHHLQPSFIKATVLKS